MMLRIAPHAGHGANRSRIRLKSRLIVASLHPVRRAILACVPRWNPSA